MRTLLLLLCATALACDGEIGNAPQGPQVPSLPPGQLPNPETCEETAGSVAPLRRISSEQYWRVVETLMPTVAAEVSRETFPETRIDQGFATDATANTVSTTESHQIEDNAEAIAAHILANADAAISAITGCVSPGFSDADLNACFDGFVGDFGRRAFRRAMTGGETTIVTGLYSAIGEEQGARAAFAAVMQYFLQAPALLYRVERGDGRMEGDGSMALSSDEVATRLAFFFRGNLPDAALQTAANESRLQDVDSVRAEATRLAADPAFVQVLGEFHRDWLHAYTIREESRAHPLFAEGVQRALSEEVAAYTRWVLSEGGQFEALMTATGWPSDAALDALYAEGPRRGILTLASVQAGFADAEVPHAIERGAFLRDAVLCGSPLTLPEGIDVAAETEATAHLPTARERLATLSERPDCRGCHSQINPLGLAFENFDQLGVWRDTENGVTIDASGSLQFADIDGQFAGPEELVDLVASSEAAQACYATQMYRFAMGREETEADGCTLARLQQRFIDSDGDIRDLAVAIATSRPFLRRVMEVSE